MFNNSLISAKCVLVAAGSHTKRVAMASSVKSKPSSSTSSASHSPKTSPNQDLVDILMELANYEKNITKQIHKFNVYNRAAAALQKLNTKIKSGAEAKKLHGIGVKIAQKIEEYLQTGQMKRLNEVRNDERNTVMKDLSRISGIGPAFAGKLISEGIRSLDDLQKHPEKLNHHQRIGLRYLTEFETRIPRSEMRLLESVLRAELRRLDERFTATICGSYRRGAEASNDIDILVTHPKCTSANKSETGTYLARVAHRFSDIGFVTDTISIGDSMFMGVCRLSDSLLYRIEHSPPADPEESLPTPFKKIKPEPFPPSSATEAQLAAVLEKRSACTIVNDAFVHRRIDIRLVPADLYYCALVHFTGNTAFNRRLRLLANERGFTLNEYGLRRLGATGVPGEAVEVNSEEEIFELVGMPFCKPENRLA